MKREHNCLSSGYNLRFIGQESVNDILQELLDKIETRKQTLFITTAH